MVVGLLVRYILAPYTADSNDVSVWVHTSLDGFYGLHLYDRAGFSYPPVWGYVLQLIGWVARVVGVGPTFFSTENPSFLTTSQVTADFSTTVASPLFNIAFKSILFAFDLCTGLVIHRLVRVLTGDSKRAALAFAVWFLNPFVIYESAVHGALDTTVGFAVIASLVFVLTGRPVFAGGAWAFGILTKLSPAVLGIQLVVALWSYPFSHNTLLSKVGRLGRFAVGAAAASLILIGPLLVSGSVEAMVHSTLVRAQGTFDVGGLSLIGIRHLRPWAWIFPWASANAALVVRASSIAQIVSACAWAAWTAIVASENRAFAILTGTVGTLASAMLLSPIANPQYVLWWLPVFISLALSTGRGYWQLVVFSLAPLVFDSAVLGPMHVLGPLATYTEVVSPTDVSAQAMQWYLLPSRWFGVYWTDDFFGPAALVTIVALIALFTEWLAGSIRRDIPRLIDPGSA